MRAFEEQHCVEALAKGGAVNFAWRGGDGKRRKLSGGPSPVTSDEYPLPCRATLRR